MTAAYKTLYQCTTCNSVISIAGDTHERSTCACGKLSITQVVSTHTKETQIYVKHQDMQLTKHQEPGPYMRRALL